LVVFDFITSGCIIFQMVLKESRQSMGSAGDQAQSLPGPSLSREKAEVKDEAEFVAEDPLPAASVRASTTARSRKAPGGTRRVGVRQEDEPHSDEAALASRNKRACVKRSAEGEVMKNAAGIEEDVLETANQAISGKKGVRKQRAAEVLESGHGGERSHLMEDDGGNVAPDMTVKKQRVVRRGQKTKVAHPSDDQGAVTSSDHPIMLESGSSKVTKGSDDDMTADSSTDAENHATARKMTKEVPSKSSELGKNRLRTQRRQNKPEAVSARADGTSEKSDSSDGLGPDLMTRSLKKLTDRTQDIGSMVLSPSQVRQSQQRFKTLYNKMVSTCIISACFY
jgi:hypothetical protein